MGRGIFGDTYALSETVVKAIPLALTGLGVALAFQIGFWNIGAEGQLYAGAIAATAVPLFFPALPRPVMLPLMALAAGLGGGILALLVVLPKVFRNVNEIITSLMLNYVAILLADYLIYGPWKDPKSFNFPLTPLYPPAAQLPTFFGTRVHLGALFVLVAALIMGFVMHRTRWGFELRLLGDSVSAARFAGVNINRYIIVAMLLSGSLAGLAGMTEVSGILHRLQRELSPGYGYSAIIVAWLARLNPWGVVAMAMFLGALFVGGYSLQTAGLSASSVFMLQGGMLFLVLIADVMLEYRFVYRTEER
jgi:simple sugar transport system permease protein